ncbi:MAG: hypothetical protein BWK76_15375 [Desulfobulbaceae bacterium A2]|nr:MAG: hypothetical protein BWK76_15375 [Desulfobulbaceae bacterium A2]
MGLRQIHASNAFGFTLVELLITLVISGVALAGVYTIFVSQQRSYIVQDEVVEMQQELRATMEIVAREIRNAGRDTTSSRTACTGGGDASAGLPLGRPFILASPFRVQVSMDLSDPPDDDCLDPNENVGFGFSDADDVIADGIADAGVASFGRDTGGGFQPISGDAIHAIGFAYAFDCNNDGLIETDNAGRIIWAVPTGPSTVAPCGAGNGLGGPCPAGTCGGWTSLDTDNDGDIDVADAATVGIAADPTQRDQIRGVKIWLLARTSRVDPQYVDTNTYKVGANVVDPIPNDNFRRRVMTTHVRCRNMGILPVP